MVLACALLARNALAGPVWPSHFQKAPQSPDATFTALETKDVDELFLKLIAADQREPFIVTLLRDDLTYRDLDTALSRPRIFNFLSARELIAIWDEPAAARSYRNWGRASHQRPMAMPTARWLSQFSPSQMPRLPNLPLLARTQGQIDDPVYRCLQHLNELTRSLEANQIGLGHSRIASSELAPSSSATNTGSQPQRVRPQVGQAVLGVPPTPPLSEGPWSVPVLFVLWATVSTGLYALWRIWSAN
jgi:hypothetical protein